MLRLDVRALCVRAHTLKGEGRMPKRFTVATPSGDLAYYYNY